MKSIHVAASREYDVLIERGLLDRAGDEIARVLPKARRALPPRFAAPGLIRPSFATPAASSIKRWTPMVSFCTSRQNKNSAAVM